MSSFAQSSGRRLSVADHSRDSAGMSYVYPVVSRRAGGVSIGINLNTNNACNWRCIYCQVPGLVRGAAPEVDLTVLAAELDSMLESVVQGDFMTARVPVALRKLVDIAFSGNGEPTSSRQFAAAVELVIAALGKWHLRESVPVRVITNGSWMDRASVQAAIARIGASGGEIWFKVDAVTESTSKAINGVKLDRTILARRLTACARHCPTWVQTCLFNVDGLPLSDSDQSELVQFLGEHSGVIRGVHLYSLARTPALPGSERLSPANEAYMNEVARRVQEKGLTVTVSP